MFKNEDIINKIEDLISEWEKYCGASIVDKIQRSLLGKLILDYTFIIINTKHSKKISPTNNKFIKPTIQEISDYCIERKNRIDPNSFYDSNESKGWVVGKNRTPMKDWKAAIRTWENNNKQESVYTKTDEYNTISDSIVVVSPWERLMSGETNKEKCLVLFYERCCLWYAVLYGQDWGYSIDLFDVNNLGEYESVYEEMASIGAGRTMKECAEFVVPYMVYRVININQGIINDTEGF